MPLRWLPLEFVTDFWSPQVNSRQFVCGLTSLSGSRRLLVPHMPTIIHHPCFLSLNAVWRTTNPKRARPSPSSSTRNVRIRLHLIKCFIYLKFLSSLWRIKLQRIMFYGARESRAAQGREEDRPCCWAADWPLSIHMWMCVMHNVRIDNSFFL